MKENNSDHLFRLLKALANGDRDEAEDAVCYLRIGIVTCKNLPTVEHDQFYATHSFNFKYVEQANANAY